MKEKYWVVVNNETTSDLYATKHEGTISEGVKLLNAKIQDEICDVMIVGVQADEFWADLKETVDAMVELEEEEGDEEEEDEEIE
jgi:hypothetical protein